MGSLRVYQLVKLRDAAIYHKMHPALTAELEVFAERAMEVVEKFVDKPPVDMMQAEATKRKKALYDALFQEVLTMAFTVFMTGNVFGFNILNPIKIYRLGASVWKIFKTIRKYNNGE